MVASTSQSSETCGAVRASSMEGRVRSDRIMTPEHPLWTEFLARLSRVPACAGTTVHARAVLSMMPGIDGEESLRALARMGARCDCEIEHDLTPRFDDLMVGGAA